MKKDEIIKLIDELLQKNTDFDTKLYLLKLKKLFINSYSIENVNETEKKLYKNKNYKQKYEFEINRIQKHMIKIGKENDTDFLKYCKFIKTKENMLNIINDDESTTYFELLLDLIKLEIDLNMKVGLFSELRDYVCRYVDEESSKDKNYK